jgi:hypothetical protein
MSNLAPKRGGIPTPAGLRQINRRADRKRDGVALVLTEMKRGAALRLQYQDGRAIWSLSSGSFVTAEIAKLVTARSEVVACGDVLFLDMPSQTWRYADV